MNKDEIVEYIYNLNLQNNTEKIDFDKAFKYGIQCAIDEILDSKIDLSNFGDTDENEKNNGRFYTNSEIEILKEECYQDGLEDGKEL